jgi:23S rRNA (cytidine1920-2'-O)/16S rRNA (cytidine1409-2'-O)-methyltransferase
MSWTPADPSSRAAKRRRLDLELVDRGLARSRAQAKALISAGQVRVDGTVVRRASTAVPATAVVQASTDPYVSRGAHKLAGALDDLGLPVPARVLDAGSSTGGFTQVLLERGARHVVAVDVGTGQLAGPLRSDPRVRLFEQTNLRDLTLAHVEEQPVDLVVADVSFISLTLLLRPLTAVTARDGALLLLVKPQFEVGRERLGPGGVVREDRLRQEAVTGVTTAAADLGWPALATVPCRVVGESGNQEYFVLLGHGSAPNMLTR